MKIYWVSIVFPLVTALSLAGIEKTYSEDKSASEPAPATTSDQTPAPPGDTSISDKPNTNENTMDEIHKRLELGILNQAIRIDNFFGSVKPEKQQETVYELRWRNSVRIEQGGRVSLGTAAWANFTFPRISDRLHLSITGEDQPQPFAQSLPEDPGNPGLDRTSQTTTHIVNTELRYGLISTPTMNLFLGAGVRFVLPIEAFLRSRFQYIYKFSDVSLVRFAETVFAKNTVGPGETTEVSLERLLNQKTILRWANSETVSYEISGVEWGTEISLIHELSAKNAITYTGGVYGNTSIPDWVTNYRILTLYRQNFLRNWLYYEIQPEVSWPRSATGTITTNYALTLRLEVVFKGGTADKGVKKEAP
ncbi:MAG: hypothetical protein ABSA86_07390 [Oryzomonas sp.]